MYTDVSYTFEYVSECYFYTPKIRELGFDGA